MMRRRFVELGQEALDGVTVTVSQFGPAVTWSFDFAEGMSRIDKDGTGYLIGYLSAEQVAGLSAWIAREAIAGGIAGKLAEIFPEAADEAVPEAPRRIPRLGEVERGPGLEIPCAICGAEIGEPCREMLP